jgi:gamma-glutamyltranspeptidase / glutathione hydrolase
MAEQRRALLSASPAGAVFLDDGFVPEPGYVLRQPELAATLERLAAHGRDGFYAGTTARRLVDGVRAAGGIWSVRDLQQYKVAERPPIRGRYRGMSISTAAPPSAGGIVLVQMLNLLAVAPLEGLTHSARDARLIEAMRLAYRDRARYLGDPDFVAIDIGKLISPAYAKTLLKEGAPRAAAAAQTMGTQTTHFSIIDRDGNRAAVTLSLNTLFGSGFMPPGTGVVLNNEMDDFAAKPGVANTYGLVGNKANAIAPGKRPLSSMTPTFLETPEAVVVLGTPGGSRITTMVLLAALEFAEGHGSVQDWVALPRFHHQYLPDVVEYEPGAFSQDEQRALQGHGYALSLREAGYGNMQALVWYKKSNRIEAASDPRGEGRATLGQQHPQDRLTK